MGYRQNLRTNRCTTVTPTLRNCGRLVRRPTFRTRGWMTGVRVPRRQRVATSVGGYPDVPTAADGECRSCGASVPGGQTKYQFCLTNHLGSDSTSTNESASESEAIHCGTVTTAD